MTADIPHHQITMTEQRMRKIAVHAISRVKIYPSSIYLYRYGLVNDPYKIISTRCLQSIYIDKCIYQHQYVSYFKYRENTSQVILWPFGSGLCSWEYETIQLIKQMKKTGRPLILDHEYESDSDSSQTLPYWK